MVLVAGYIGGDELGEVVFSKGGKDTRLEAIVV